MPGKLPIIEPESPFHHPGQWWHADGDRVVCDLCPRECSLNEGDRGFCFVRQNIGGKMALTTYGRSTGFCIDPIEKKPLNHFHPGTSVLSFGTAGCNLGCKFCQNWDISKSREVERLSSQAFPEDIARAALTLECRSVAFTYNDPIIWAEYAIDTARACRAVGVCSVAVTAGYITEEAREPFFSEMDAANVDLKAFTEEFYHNITASHLQPVLDTLRWLKHETDVWFEITNLIIPDANDSADELKQMCDWILEAVGAEVPVHFSGFHPDYRMMDRPHTPAETLNRAREIAMAAGLQYAYTGNVNDHQRQSTYCPNCKAIVIERDRYSLGTYNLNGNRCRDCHHRIPGHFDASPGTWGARRLPVDMRQFGSAISTTGSTESDKPMTQSQIQLDGLAELSADESDALLLSVATFLADSSVGTQTKLADPTIQGLGEKSIYGTFVSAKRNGALRSCCGTLGKPMPLADSLRHSAHRTATDDPRFPPITARELEDLEIEVWLLKSPERIDGPAAERIRHVQVGVHGLQVLRGKNCGLLLPGVPVEHQWSEEEYLNQTCKKAGLPPTAWRDDATTVLRFEGLSCASLLRDTGIEIPVVVTKHPFSAQEFAQYCQHCRSSIETLLSGGVPMYYLPQVSDAEVNGVILTARVSGTDQEFTISRLSVKQQFPFQSTLFSLCQDAAKVLARSGHRSGALEIGLTIVNEPSMLGPVDGLDVHAVDTTSCGLLVVEGKQSGFTFDSQKSPVEVLANALNAAGLDDKPAGMAFSLVIQSNQERVVFGQKPKAASGASVRPSAVAGTFYPAQAAVLTEMVEGFFGSFSAQSKQRWAACMVPHAGLRYSGQLAADVLSRIELPELIIAIGPKHTPHGVNWAVAPHEQWSTPLGHMESDTQLAAALVAAIRGLELDAAAHAREHAIEVELPLIQWLSPKSRVVGIAIGGGTFEQCDQFARGLAEIIRQLATPPLLLISSDMNHFANENETHRLDTLALTQIDQLDPAGLLETVRSNHISMCGVLPAVIVMQTLKHLGKLTMSRRVGYTTSAAVSGDTSRVVGYAGVLFN